MAAVARDFFVRKHWERRYPCLRSAGILTGDFVQHRRAPRNRRHNQNRIAFLDRRVRPVSMTNVLVIHIHIHEISQRVLIVEKMATQFTMRRCQLIKRFARGARVNLNL